MQRDGDLYWRIPPEISKRNELEQACTESLLAPYDKEVSVQPLKLPPSPEIISTAAHLLAEVFGSPIQLSEGDILTSSGRANVYRLHVLATSGNVPISVIVKQLQKLPAWPFFNDWASLQFLSQEVPAVPFAPRFYAGDSSQGVFVMEDLGKGQRLDHLLLGNDPVAAEAALVEHATIHGRLHAITMGKHAEYGRIRRRLSPLTEEDDYFALDQLAPTLHQTARLVGVVPAPGVDRELATLVESLQNPGPFLTFIQGDSCPDNCLYNDSSLRLLDFEGGRFAHALLEGVYGRIHFPTCWCVYRIPEQIPLRMEAAYRAELIKGCPAAADDTLFYRAVVIACTFWMLDWYRSIPLPKLLENDRLIVAASDRQRIITRADILIQTIEQFGYLEAIGATIHAITTKLRSLWPETEEMAYYPAFR